jgi:hypothetical protein
MTQREHKLLRQIEQSRINAVMMDFQFFRSWPDGSHEEMVSRWSA